MAGIEFVEDEPVQPVAETLLDPRGTAPGRRLPGRAARLVPAVAVLGFLASAVLAVLAARSTLYTVGFGPGGHLFRYSIDASGDYHGVGELTRERQHGARFSWLLVACSLAALAVAALLAARVLVVAGILPAARTLGSPARRWRALGPQLGIAVAGVLCGVVLAMFSDVSAVFDSVRARTEIGVQSGDPIRADLITVYGPCLRLATAAGLCAILGCLAGLAPTVRARGAAEGRHDAGHGPSASRSPAP